MLLEWLKRHAGGEGSPNAQQSLWTAAPYIEEKPVIQNENELAGALEHLEYAVHRRYHNQLTRADRARLDNTIQNALFKIDRYLERLDGPDQSIALTRCRSVRQAAQDGRERLDRQRQQARRAELKLAQLDALSPEGFEEFIAELFDALGYEVECVGGTGDEGVDLWVRKQGLQGVVQCKYHKSRGVIGSAELQKFLGTIHHTRSHKGFFATTRTFSIAAERFAADHPIELIDGPRLVELVHEAMGPAARPEPANSLF
jgi:restriction system protein